MKKFSEFINIFIFSSITTIFFGLVFGEFFGIELYHPLINRNPEHDIVTLITAAIIIGAVHINIGLVIGFINELKEHGFKRAFFEKCGWFLLQIAGILLFLSYTQRISANPTIGYFLLVLAAAILYKGEGVRGLIEIPSIISQILSYLRLMAIGLSSVGIALVVNSIAQDFFKIGGFSIVWGILILLVGHITNFIIGCFGGFLHSLRLHYVELFGKFYKGGGIPFAPFGTKY